MCAREWTNSSICILDITATKSRCNTTRSGNSKPNGNLNLNINVTNVFISNLLQPQNIIRLLDASYVDGTIYCKILRDPRTNIFGNNIDLINNKYHLLIAAGEKVTRTFAQNNFNDDYTFCYLCILLFKI